LTSGVALTQCEALVVSKDRFVTTLTGSVDLACSLLALLGQDVCVSIGRRADWSQLSARARFAKVISDLLELQEVHVSSSPAKIQLPIKVVDLAQATGVAPESMSRLLAELKHAGALEVRRGWLILHKSPQSE
jgi:CRP-like cAMP-binding protein